MHEFFFLAFPGYPCMIFFLFFPHPPITFLMVRPLPSMYLFDIGYPCFTQLTPVNSRYPLTSITWPYRRLKFRAHRGHLCFESWPLTNCWFFYWIAGSFRINLFKTGLGCPKCQPRIKNQSNYSLFITLSSIQMFFPDLFCVHCDYENSKLYLNLG